MGPQGTRLADLATAAFVDSMSLSLLLLAIVLALAAAFVAIWAPVERVSALAVVGLALAPPAGAVDDVNTDRVAGTTRYGLASQGVDYALDGTITAAPTDRGNARSYTVKRRSALSPAPGLPGVLR